MKKKNYLSVLKIVVCFLFICFVRINHIISIDIVDGKSMQNTIKDGQILLSSSLVKPERGSIVAAVNNKGTNIIKRVVGLPGDTIVVSDGVIYINGEQLDEPYLDAELNTKKWNRLERTLGEDEYWILGDNRDNSHDSRAFGPVKEKDILSTILFKK